MKYLAQYLELVKMSLLSYRAGIAFVMMVQIVLTIGLVLGYGYLIPDIPKVAALYVTTGAATNAAITVSLVVLPQILAEAKHQGRMDYMLTLPISRELYLLSQVTTAVILALPGTALAVVFGAWRYDLSLSVNPLLPLVALLAVFSLAGVGVAVAALSNHLQVTNAITQLTIFYVIFFAPILMPKEQLPGMLQSVSTVMPPTYAADGMRGALTDLPGTNLGRDLAVLAAFAAGSLTLSAVTIRRRG
ncbi:MAG TPA: ABC transporter permease [Tepidiformaceae bacterium]|nr:ABC transporter permease [Tepidiformaceae bacterium]